LEVNRGMKHLLFGWHYGTRPQHFLFFWLFWLLPLFVTTVSGFSQTQPLNGPWIADGAIPAIQSVNGKSARSSSEFEANGGDAF
jgi:hypothetical protein